jgi:hypothetical protein
MFLPAHRGNRGPRREVCIARCRRGPRRRPDRLDTRSGSLRTRRPVRAAAYTFRRRIRVPECTNWACRFRRGHTESPPILEGGTCRLCRSTSSAGNSHLAHRDAEVPRRPPRDRRRTWAVSCRRLYRWLRHADAGASRRRRRRRRRMRCRAIYQHRGSRRRRRRQRLRPAQRGEGRCRWHMPRRRYLSQWRGWRGRAAT